MAFKFFAKPTEQKKAESAINDIAALALRMHNGTYPAPSPYSRKPNPFSIRSFFRLKNDGPALEISKKDAKLIEEIGNLALNPMPLPPFKRK